MQCFQELFAHIDKNSGRGGGGSGRSLRIFFLVKIASKGTSLI